MAGPVTLQDLYREGKLLWLYCTDCGRERDIDPTSLPLPGSMPVPSVGKRLKCSQCGGRNVTAAPELHPDGVTQYRERFR